MRLRIARSGLFLAFLLRRSRETAERSSRLNTGFLLFGVTMILCLLRSESVEESFPVRSGSLSLSESFRVSEAPFEFREQVIDLAGVAGVVDPGDD